MTTNQDSYVHYDGLLRKLLTVLAFPLTIGATVGGGLVAITRGHDPATVLVIGTIIGALTIALLEVVHPHTRQWSKSRGDVGTDLKHLVFTTITSTAVIELIVTTLFGLLAIQLAGVVGVSIWPGQLHLGLQFVLAMVITEFGYYWYHRIAHEGVLFWKLHATHHSVERLYWFNANRFHPFDNWISYTLQTAPLLLLGASKEVIAMFALFTAVHGMFQHANIRLNLGPLNWIFSMAELHRWHHSRDIEKANKNYGANLIIWDVVFGTRYLPKDEQQATDDIGMDMPDFPKTYWAQLTSPFRWRQISRD